MSIKIRIIGFILGILTMLMVMYLVRRNKLSTVYSLTWFILGFALILFSVFKDLIFNLSELMGIHFPPLAFFVMASLGQTLVLIHLSIIVSQQFRMIKKLEKDLALVNEKRPEAH